MRMSSNLTILAIGMIMLSCPDFSQSTRLPRSDWSSNIPPTVDCVCDDPVRHPRASRGPFGTSVYGYPSKGGIYVLDHVGGVELEFLGFERFNPNSSVDFSAAESEEQHCNKMRELGATWWSSQHEYDMDSIFGETHPDTETYLRVGWPASGGVWVLHVMVRDAVDIGAGIINNAYTMEERCMAIQKVGGVFYENPGDCPSLDLAWDGETQVLYPDDI